MMLASVGVISACSSGSAQTAAPATTPAVETTAAVEATVAETTAAESTSSNKEYDYNYEGLEDFWYTPMPERGGVTYHEALSPMASSDADMDQFIHSPFGKFTLVSRQILSKAPIDTPEWTEHWADLGMIHEVHDMDDNPHHWVSVVPEDVNSNPDQERPLLFVWHGNGNPLMIAETYGFIEPAVERGWLVVLPWADNDDEYLEEFDRILDYMKDNYSVDTSRIYTTGFSKGGRVSAHLALKRSDVVTAAAACATNTSAAFFTEGDSSLELSGPQMLTDEDFIDVKTSVPVMFWGGQYDVYGAMPYNNETKIGSLNNWLKLHGSESLQSYEESEKLVSSNNGSIESIIGLTFDKTETVEIDGTTNYIGSYLNAEGEEVVQIAYCETVKKSL